MQRVLEPEVLDFLPCDDPRARRSRADLRRINVLMGNARHIARELDGTVRTLLDLGAGDGDFARRIARPGVRVTLLDRLAFPPAPGFTRVQEDVHRFLERTDQRFDAIISNLFLHHLEREALRALLELVAIRTALFIACEPRRSRSALAASRLTWVLGAGAVTRHDARSSVRAGFRGHELSELWPRTADAWHVCERAAWPFSHLFVARRDGAL
jgi:2-polyprenyl-3-methyl-5-hydroxy-6-metoxy-1,4-benzoquinol methylase